MTFGGTFGRVIQRPFGGVPSSAAAGWWLSGGIAAANCVAAFAAKGAASYAASKVNLTGNAAYDISDGAAYPAWNVTTGWTFTGESKQYLKSALLVNNKPVTYIALINTSGTTNYRTLIGGAGEDSTRGGLSLDLTTVTNVPRVLKQSLVLIGAGTTGFSASTPTNVAITYSAIGAWAHYLNGSANGSGTKNQTLIQHAMVIGGQFDDTSGDLKQPYNGSIIAMAIYNIVLDATTIGTLATAMAAL